MTCAQDLILFVSQSAGVVSSWEHFLLLGFLLLQRVLLYSIKISLYSPFLLCHFCHLLQDGGHLCKKLLPALQSPNNRVGAITELVVHPQESHSYDNNAMTTMTPKLSLRHLFKDLYAVNITSEFVKHFAVDVHCPEAKKIIWESIHRCWAPVSTQPWLHGLY